MTHHLRDQRDSKCDTCVSATFQEYPPKKAWGCPVCGTCFNTDREWYQHEKVHYTDVITQGRQIFITGWNKNLLVTALLKSNYLRSATAGYSWSLCHWDCEDIIGDLEFKRLIFAPERQCLPPLIKKDGIYARLSNKKALVAYAYYMGCYGAPFPPVGDSITLAADLLSSHRQVAPTTAPMGAKEITVHQENASNTYQSHRGPGKEACLDVSSYPGYDTEPVSSLTCAKIHKHSDLPRQTSENSLHFTPCSETTGRGVIGRMVNPWEGTSSLQHSPEKVISARSSNAPLTTRTNQQHQLVRRQPISSMSQSLSAELQQQHDTANFYGQFSPQRPSQHLPNHVLGRSGNPQDDHTSQLLSLNAYIDPGLLEHQRIPNPANVETSVHPWGVHLRNELHNDRRDSTRMSWIGASVDDQVLPGTYPAFVPNDGFLREFESSADPTPSSLNSRLFQSGHNHSSFSNQQTSWLSDR